MTKRYIIYILIIICVWALLIGSKKNRDIESLEMYEKTEIVGNLNREKNGSGFYSRFFQIVNYFVFCEKNKVNFTIKSDDWMFKWQHGWSDYFEDISLNFYTPEKVDDKGLHDILDDTLKIIDYKNAIPKVYKYNQYTKDEIQKIRKSFSLENGKYDSIFIRRGDKLSSESVFIHEDKYLDLLLRKNPNCKTIFLQTDDYNCFLELEKQIKTRKLPIQLFTICDKDSVGVIVNRNEKDNLNNAVQHNETNKQYLSTVIDKLNNTKPVAEMNSEEIRKHTMDMLIGVDIVCNSNICITDYQSNVSRFIKLFHRNPSNVYDISNPEKDIDYEKVICPTFGF